MPISKEEGDGKLREVSVAVQTETDTHSRINQVSTNTRGGNHRRTDEDTGKKEMIPGKAPQRTGSDSKKKKRNQRKRISRKERNQVRAHYGNEGGSSKEMVVKMPIGTNSQVLTFWWTRERSDRSSAGNRMKRNWNATRHTRTQTLECTAWEEQR